MQKIEVKTGLDVLVEQQFSIVQKQRVGLLCNQASIASNYTHAIELFFKASQQGILNLATLFGPQHGLFGHTQDNMIEWEGYHDPFTGAVVYSLYGENRKPTKKMLSHLDVLVIDLQDVGARYYTFIWTMALCLEACAEQKVPVVVLDRPNPISGKQVEGTWLKPNFKSFVGWHPLPVRHGLTIGELAQYFKTHFYPQLDLHIVPLQNWSRQLYFDETALPWAMPSPNMPTVETAVVYPGMCLLEATNLSEGRGTTRPFEIFGAPWIDHWRLANVLNGLQLPGVYFRPLEFQPTFNKYQGQICRGCFMHVTNRKIFKPFVTAIAILREVIVNYQGFFEWKQPPYEYEYHKLPFDILVGNSWLRVMLEAGSTYQQMEIRWQKELKAHLSELEPFQLYQ